MTDRVTTPFGFESTAADVIDGVDLTGKTADRHRGVIGNRRRNRAGVGRRGRVGHARCSRHLDRRSRRRRDPRQHGQCERHRRRPRPQRPVHRRDIRPHVVRATSHPGEQRRRDGGSGTDLVTSWPRNTVRDKPLLLNNGCGSLNGLTLGPPFITCLRHCGFAGS